MIDQGQTKFYFYAISVRWLPATAMKMNSDVIPALLQYSLQADHWTAWSFMGDV